MALVTTLSSHSAYGQVLYGSLVGQIRDTSGAVVPGATVTITNIGTGQTHTATSSPTGGYTFTNVAQGNYDLEATAQGFRAHALRGVPITVNTVRRIEVVLEVGQISETVTVEAQALALQTDQADVHVDLEKDSITDLPLPSYRNYQSLINLVPGATPARSQHSVVAAPQASLQINFNGVNRNNNGNKLDGMPNLFIWLSSQTNYTPPAETIETVNISTNSFDAEQGMAGGAAVNVITKSGTNELHGSVFAFHENEKLQARNFFNDEKPSRTNNTDGFTVGGPIKKDKFFFFGGWEGVREREGTANTNLTVATADQRAGDFSAYNATIFDPATGNPDGSGRTAFANNVVPINRQSGITRQMQDLVPMPTRAGTISNFAASDTFRFNRDNYDIKVNWNSSESLSVWGKYSLMDSSSDCFASLGPAGGPGLCGSNTTADGSVKSQLSTLGWTKTISPTFLYDATLGWSRMDQELMPKGVDVSFGLDVLGIPGTNGPERGQGGQPTFNIAGYTRLGENSAWVPSSFNDTSYSTEHNFTKIAGTHEIRFGFQGIRHWLNHWIPEINGGPRGWFEFTQGVTGAPGGPALTQYNSYASFLLGLPNFEQKALQYEKMTGFEWQLGWYVRDRWRVTPNMTLSLGVRYENYPMMTRSGRGGIEQWDPDTNLVTLGGIGGNPKDLGITTSNKLFAPRIGLAYRVSDSMVIRSGYGITYDPLSLVKPNRGLYPLTIGATFEAPNGFQPFAPIEDGIPLFDGPGTDSGVVELPATVRMQHFEGGKVTRGYVQSWNLMIERTLPGSFIASVGYVGSQTVHSFNLWEANHAPPGGGSAGRTFFEEFGRTGDTRYFQGRSGANYHSFQMAINRRAADGLTLKGAYTYSKAINLTDEDGNGTFMWNYLPQFSRNRAVAGYDRAHVFHMAFVYELPFGPGRRWASRGPGRWILGDWQVNGVVGFYTGLPFNLSASSASLNAPGNSQTPDQVKSEVTKMGGIGRGEYYYDPTAFAPIAETRFGSVGRNVLRGPGRQNLDFSLFRTFPLSERFKLQFRAEAFNLTNTPHFGNPSSNVNTGSFMQILSADPDQRRFRLGLRFEF